MRGPLTRMVIGKTTARIDLIELDSPRRRAADLLDHLLLRNDQAIEVDPAPLTEDPRLERRLSPLYAHATPIGSASCRERVCQYVKISVVAGSLKTKTRKENIVTLQLHK